MKEGYKTTEFWLVLAANIIGLLVMSNAIPVDSVWAKIVAFAGQILATMGYTYGRSIVKAAPGNGSGNGS